jgi:hypothetical protein
MQVCFDDFVGPPITVMFVLVIFFCCSCHNCVFELGIEQITFATMNVELLFISFGNVLPMLLSCYADMDMKTVKRFR